MAKRLQCKTWPKKSLIAYQIAKRWVQAMSEWWTIHADPTIFRTSWNGRLERWVRRWIVGWEWRRQWWHWNCGTRKRKWRRGDSWWLDYHDLRQGRIASHEAGWIQSPNSPRQSLDLAWWPGLCFFTSPDCSFISPRYSFLTSTWPVQNVVTREPFRIAAGQTIWGVL